MACADAPGDDSGTLSLSGPPSATANAAPNAEGSARFQSGELIQGRYLIVRFIAEGGMGEVYEADDRALGERVALKTLRGTRATDAAAQERFKTEIQLARRVTHPGVCRIHDMSFHEADGHRIAFLSMELIRGEPLSTRLRRGPLAADEALPIARALIDGLASAHDAGVVHRDFKSANVILAAKDGRPVITDFGLALSFDRDKRGPSEPGAVLGTPEYMAPEQLAGGEITPATDLYALGVVLYEMVTGRRPFAGTARPAPEPPRTHAPQLPAAWNAAILRCLAEAPRERFQNARELGAALAGSGNRRPAKTGRALAAAAVAAASIAAAGYYLMDHGSSPAHADRRRSVALLGFSDLSGPGQEAAWLSTALAEMMSTELAIGEKLYTVPAEEVARAKLELGVSSPAQLGPELRAKLRADLHSDLVMFGSYLAMPGEDGGLLRLDLRVEDTARGEAIVTVTETGTQHHLFDLVSRTGSRVRKTLGIGELSAAENEIVRASISSNPEAARAYAEGLAALEAFEAARASEALRKSIAADPGVAEVHSALAAARAALGYELEAREEAKKAYELSAGLPREARLSIEARYRETTGEWDRAVAVYRGLVAFFPDNLDYGLRLASALSSAGLDKEARAALASLRTLPPPASTDPRIALAEALASEAISDFAGEKRAALEAVSQARATGAKLLVAAARLREGFARFNLAEVDDARAAFREAEEIYTAANDRSGVTHAMIDEAMLLAGSDPRSAREMMRRAVELDRQAGNRSGEARGLNELGYVSDDLGDEDDAAKSFREAIAIDKELGKKRWQAYALGNLGGVLHNQAKNAEAIVAYREAIALERELGDDSGIAAALSGVAVIEMGDGDLAGAKEVRQEALELCRRTGGKEDLGYALVGLADTLYEQDDLLGARKHEEEAIAVMSELGKKGNEAESRRMLAEILLAQGNAGEAVEQATLALARSRELAQGDEALFEARLALALLGARRTGEARAEMTKALSLPAESLRPGLRWTLACDRALVAAGAGASKAELAGAFSALAEAQKEIAASHDIYRDMTVRLALGSLELASGRGDAGRKHLRSVALDAHRLGFVRLERSAKAALR